MSLPSEYVAVLDENGNTVVSYGYDAWGASLWCTGELAETLGKVQPFRYRGYVFDEETGLYYLRSRYYNSALGRFLNADAVITSYRLIGGNMYAYCLNNPVAFRDLNGASASTATFSMALYSDSAGKRRIEDGTCYEFIIIGGMETSVRIRDQETNAPIGIVYAYAQTPDKQRLRYVGEAQENGTKLLINSDFGEGTVPYEFCLVLREVDPWFYDFGPYILGTQECHAKWPKENVQKALVEWRATVNNSRIPPYTAEDIDGSYGPATETIVKWFQHYNGLNEDGWTGDETKQRLYNYYPSKLKVFAP